MVTPQYAYLFSVSGLIPIWILFFLIRSDIRMKMLKLSILGAPLGPLSQIYYLKDYWEPIFTLNNIGFIHIEDLMFAFLLVGITGVIYNFITGKKTIANKKTNIRKSIKNISIFVSIIALSLIFLTNVLNINSIYSSSFAFVLTATLIWNLRKDLIRPSLIVGGIFAIFTFITYNILLIIFPDMIRDWWLLKNISGILINGVPLEEMIWFSGWGLVGSVLYEWGTDKKYK